MTLVKHIVIVKELGIVKLSKNMKTDGNGEKMKQKDNTALVTPAAGWISHGWK